MNIFDTSCQLLPLELVLILYSRQLIFYIKIFAKLLSEKWYLTIFLLFKKAFLLYYRADIVVKSTYLKYTIQ